MGRAAMFWVMTLLTTVESDGIIVNMDATLLQRVKRDTPDGAIVEIVIWRVPETVQGSKHLYKYRLFYGRDGKRLVGFDNERGKGDHCHIDGSERPYEFSDVDTLVRDFFAAIAERNAK
jgi:hypothetical protein